MTEIIPSMTFDALQVEVEKTHVWVPVEVSTHRLGRLKTIDKCKFCHINRTDKNTLDECAMRKKIVANEAHALKHNNG
jgi:biotin synthase-like enzyme